MNLVAGSSGITYPKMAGAAGVVFAGMLGMAMWKNISSETAFSDKRFKTTTQTKKETTKMNDLLE